MPYLQPVQIKSNTYKLGPVTIVCLHSMIYLFGVVFISVAGREKTPDPSKVPRTACRFLSVWISHVQDVGCLHQSSGAGLGFPRPPRLLTAGG